MSIPVYGPEQEKQFLTENILGKLVTEVHASDDGIAIEMDGKWVLSISLTTGLTWYRIEDYPARGCLERVTGAG